jgi:hypothetical protein
VRHARLVAAALLFVSTAASADDNTFKSVTVGFELTKPAEWQFVTAEQNLENLKRAEFANEEFHAQMLKYATAPLVAIMKYPEPYDDVNPSFKVNIKPFGQLKGTPPTDILKLLTPQFQSIFADFSVVVQPTEVTVSNRAAGYVRLNYSLAADGRTFPATSELWIVPRGDYFFLIGAGTRQDEKTGSRAEIQAILDSVRIAD